MKHHIVGTTLLLGFWTAKSIAGFHEGDYIILYAGFGMYDVGFARRLSVWFVLILGFGQAVFAFLLTWALAWVLETLMERIAMLNSGWTSLIGIHSSLNLFTSALKSVLASPVSFFDTTPLGRILSRLSKDQDTLDTVLPMSMLQVGRSQSIRAYPCFADYATVSDNFQLSSWYHWSSILYLSLARYHLCTNDPSLLAYICVLSANFGRSKTLGFSRSVKLLQLFLRYCWVLRFVMFWLDIYVL